jgi:hypothetical protein
MATVDTLLVRIEADISDLKRDLRRATKTVDNSADKMKRSFNRIGKVAKIAIAGVAVRAISQATVKMINMASGAEEMQGKSSVVFGKFRDDVVSALDDFGNEVGRSTFALEGMASSLQDTFVPMGFARGEAAKLSVEMTKLAVDVGSFNDANEVDTMRAFQSALVGNHETVRRFGVVITEATLNQELLTMGIEGGARAASNAEKVQARMNLIMKGTTDAQGDAARTSTSFANELRALKANFSEFITELGMLFLPIATKVIKALNVATDAVRGLFAALRSDDKPASSIESVEESVEIAKQALVDFEKEYKRVVDLAENGDDGAATSIDGLIERRKALTENLEKQQKILKKLIETQQAEADTAQAAEILSPDTTQFDAEMNKQAKAFRDAGLLAAGYSQALIDAAEAAGTLNQLNISKDGSIIEGTMGSEGFRQLELLQAATDKIAMIKQQIADKSAVEAEAVKHSAALNQKFAETKEMAENLVDPLKGTKDQMEALRLAFAMGKIDAELFKEAMAILGESLQTQTPLMETFNSSVATMAQNFSNSLADMMVSGKMNLDGLKDIFKSFVKTMLAKAIELFFINQMMNAIFGGVSGYVPLPQMNLSGRASGGNVNSNQPYLVGERGPELFVPSSAGNVMNNANTKSIGGGGAVVNQTINVNAGVSQTVRAEMLNLLPSIKQDTLNAVIDSKNRGGSFSKAFA